MIDAYRKACVDASRQTGETIDQGLESWEETDDAGLEGQASGKAP